jgi:hypothetical protein
MVGIKSRRHADQPREAADQESGSGQQRQKNSSIRGRCLMDVFAKSKS